MIDNGTGNTPANEAPETPPEKPALNMATSAIVGALMGLQNSVVAILNILGGPQPGRFVITENGVSIYRAQSLRLALRNWVLAVSAADTYQLRAGSQVVATMVFGAAGTVVVPLEVALQPGTDLSTVPLGGGAVVSSYVIATTEGES